MRPPNAVTCSACHGRGEVHFSPTHEEHRCSRCGGKGWTLPQVAPVAPRTSPLASLAAQYRQAAGVAFGAGRDADATAFREAASALDDLASRLPALPVVTR